MKNCTKPNNRITDLRLAQLERRVARAADRDRPDALIRLALDALAWYENGPHADRTEEDLFVLDKHFERYMLYQALCADILALMSRSAHIRSRLILEYPALELEYFLQPPVRDIDICLRAQISPIVLRFLTSEQRSDLEEHCWDRPSDSIRGFLADRLYTSIEKKLLSFESLPPDVFSELIDCIRFVTRAFKRYPSGLDFIFDPRDPFRPHLPRSPFVTELLELYTELQASGCRPWSGIVFAHLI